MMMGKYTQDYEVFECDKCSFKALLKHHIILHKRSHLEKDEAVQSHSDTVSSYHFLLEEEEDLYSDFRPPVKRGRKCDYNSKGIIYKCDLCPYETPVKARIGVHRNTHFDKEYVCDQCPYRAHTKGQLKLHEAVHTDVKEFACDECQFMTKRKQTLKLHKKIHAGDKPYKCSACPFRGLTKVSLSRHFLSHTQEKPFKCDFCDFRTNNKVNIKKHTASAHSNDRPYKCEQCSFSSGWKSALTRHILRHKVAISKGSNVKDEDLKFLTCHSCSYETLERYNLVRHLRTHSNERPYICNECPYRATQKSALLAHLRSHSRRDGRIYSCNHCSYQAAHASELACHVRTHGHIKLLDCPHCSYITRSLRCLNKHFIASHGIDKSVSELSSLSFRCDDCDYSTPKREALKTHLQVIHKLEPSHCDHCKSLLLNVKEKEMHCRFHKVMEGSQSDSTSGQFFKEEPTPSPVPSDGSPSPSAESNSDGTQDYIYICSHCTFTSSNEDEINEHLRNHTTAENPLPTSVTMELSGEVLDVDWEIPVQHEEESTNSSLMYTCSVCSFRTFDEVALTYHLQTHSNVGS